jgi:hypothetical protein
MWKRRSAEEIEQVGRRKLSSWKNPRSALLFAAFLSVITFIFWVLGTPSKFSERPPDPKSWSQVIHFGPQYFAVTFGFLFLLLYAFQRLSGHTLGEPQLQVLICPECYTPQFENERRCTCASKLEPLENWKWVEV